MANEQKAKAYEVIVACALKAYFGKDKPVAREHTFPNVNMRTDVVIGSVEAPEAALLVTHSGSEVDYTKKLPRDIAELVELAYSVPQLRRTVLIVFDRHLLPGLMKMAEALFTNVVDMSAAPNSKRLFALSDSIDVSDLAIKAKSDHEIELACSLLSGLLGKDGRQYLFSVGQYISKHFDSPDGINSQSFSAQSISLVRSRRRLPTVRSIRRTRVRRGIGKLALFNSAERARILRNEALTGDYVWAERLGLVRRGLSKSGEGGRYKVIDPEIISGELNGHTVEGVLDCLNADEIDYCIATTAVRLKREQIQLVVECGVVGTAVATRKGLLQGHLLEKRDRQYL